MAPDPWLLAAGTLVLALGVFHSVLGELYLVRRLLRRDNLPKLFGGDSFTKLTIRYAWHLLTLFAVFAAALLYEGAIRPGGVPTDGRTVFWFLFLLLAACGAWGLVATRGRHLSWVVFALAAAFTYVGAGL